MSFHGRKQKMANMRKRYGLLEQHGYEVLEGKQLTDEDIPRLLELYNALYLQKYSMYNPQFNERFFALALKKRDSPAPCDPKKWTYRCGTRLFLSQWGDDPVKSSIRLFTTRIYRFIADSAGPFWRRSSTGPLLQKYKL